MNYSQYKTIVIIGPPASGKTTFSKELAKSLGWKLIHTDDYEQYGFEESLYALMRDLAQITEPVIVEGIQCYRLLRKGVERGTFFPNLVIEILATKQNIYEIYKRERDPEKFQWVEKLMSTNQKILGDYNRMIGDKRPQWEYKTVIE